MKCTPAICLIALLTLGARDVNAGAQSVAPDAELKVLLDEDLEASLRRNPLQATVRGITGYGHLLPDVSVAALRREQARERRALERLRALDSKALRGQDKVSYALLRDKLEIGVEGQQFTDAEALVLSTLGGLQNYLPRAAQVTPFRTADDYRDYVQRIRGMPKLVTDTIERLDLGIANGWMSTKPVLDRVVAAIDAHLVDRAETSPLLAPFARRPRAFSTLSSRRSGPMRNARSPTTTSRRCVGSRLSSPTPIGRRRRTPQALRRIPTAPAIISSSSARGWCAVSRRSAFTCWGSRGQAAAS
jgi:uncharacterized protein (DUF885 family)